MWLLQVSLCMYGILMMEDRLVWNIKLVFILFTTFSEKGVTHLSGVIMAFSSTQLFSKGTKPRWNSVIVRLPLGDCVKMLGASISAELPSTSTGLYTSALSVAHQKTYVSSDILVLWFFLKQEMHISFVYIYKSLWSVARFSCVCCWCFSFQHAWLF